MGPGLVWPIWGLAKDGGEAAEEGEGADEGDAAADGGEYECADGAALGNLVGGSSETMIRSCARRW